jgi:hypothetical protein
MADALHITVLTPERAVLDEDVYSVTAPGAAGYLGILRNHAALITSLVPGKLTVKDLRQQPTVYAIGGGFLEVATTGSPSWPTRSKRWTRSTWPRRRRQRRPPSAAWNGQDTTGQGTGPGRAGPA